jgi:hypothetical protein
VSAGPAVQRLCAQAGPPPLLLDELLLPTGGPLQSAPMGKPLAGAFFKRASVAGPQAPSSLILSPGLFRFQRCWKACTSSPLKLLAPLPV